MYSTLNLLFFAAILILEKFSSSHQANFLTSTLSQFEGIKSIAKDIPSAIEEITNPIDEATNPVESGTPLTFLAPMDEMCLVNHTGQSLEMSFKNPSNVTFSVMTGGIFGEKKYKYHNYQLYQRNSASGTILESRVMHYNIEHGSYEEALRSKDVVQLLFTIAVREDESNPLYDEFAEIIRNDLNEPGDHTEVRCGISYLWFVDFPNDGIYTYYPACHNNGNAGPTSDCTLTIELPKNPSKNFISQNQMRSTIGKFVEPQSSDFTIPSSQSPTLTPAIKTSKGIDVINLPS